MCECRVILLMRNGSSKYAERVAKCNARLVEVCGRTDRCIGAERKLTLTQLSTSSVSKRSALSPIRALVSAVLIAGFMASSVSTMTPAVAQSPSGIADYIPDSALFFGEIELDQTSDQYVKSSELLERANLVGLIPDDELADFQTGVQLIGAFVDGEAGFFLAELPLEEGFGLDDITSDASDVSMNPAVAVGGDVPEGWAIVVRPSDVDTSFNFYSDSAFDEDLADPVESEYGGFTILTQEPADEFSSGVSMAIVDDVIVIASISDDIEPVIDTVNGDLAPLSGDDSYNDVRDSLEADVLVSAYINGPALLDELDEQDPAALASIPEELTASFEVYSGFVFWADDPGFRLDTIALRAEGTAADETSVFEPAFTANIPANSLFYAGGADLGQEPTVNALALLAALGALGMDSLDPVATPIADPEAYAEQVFADAEAVIGFNIKTDVLDQLVGEWAVAGSVANITDPEPEFEGIFVTEVSDGETVEGVASTITNMIASQAEEGVVLSSRQVNGSDITVLDLSEDGTPIVFEFGVVDNQLLIGVNEGLDGFIGGQAEPLADDATFQDTLAELPSEYTAVSYLNVQSLLPLIEEGIAMSSTSSVLDNDPSCGEFDTQEEAQAAYDADEFENFSLDLDFDGEACEDFFGASATPATADTGIGEINVLSIGSVTFTDGETSGSSTIILIGE